MNHTRRWLVLVFMIIALAALGWVYFVQYAKRLQSLPRAPLSSEEKIKLMQALKPRPDSATPLTNQEKLELMQSLKAGPAAVRSFNNN